MRSRPTIYRTIPYLTVPCYFTLLRITAASLRLRIKITVMDDRRNEQGEHSPVISAVFLCRTCIRRNVKDGDRYGVSGDKTSEADHI